METVVNAYEQAKQSKEYKMIVGHRGWKDISTESQQKNGTFVFQTGKKKNGFRYNEKRIFGVFVHNKEKEISKGYFEGEGTFKVKRNMESWPTARKQLEMSYEDAFRTIYKLQINYEKSK